MHGSYIWKEFLLESPIPEYTLLGDNIIIADNMHHFYNITKYDVIGAGTHAFMGPMLSPVMLDLGKKYHPEEGRGWYRSPETVSGVNPYGGYLTNKKWHLNEVNIKDAFSSLTH